MSRTTTGTQETYVSLKKNASAIGLKINKEKTKILTQTRSNKNLRRITLEDNIQVVDDFTYLGVELNKNATEDPEIHRRITLVNKTYFTLPRVPLKKHP